MNDYLVHPNTVKARKLRQSITPAEYRLWFYLRNKEYFPNIHFKRQKPINPFIVDFYCHSAKLAIELDGSHHSTKKAREYDAQRTLFLESKGIKVLRFWNGDVVSHCEEVLKTIQRNMESRL